MTADLNQDDRGKTVVYQNNRIGVVTDVRSGTAYVDPDFDHVPEQLRATLGWDGDEYALPESTVRRVANDQLHLRNDLVA